MPPKAPVIESRSDHLYDYPRYYDLIFTTGWQQEYRFLRECFVQYAGFPLRRVFEPACGTGRLLVRFGRDGIEAAGNDLNAKAIAFCNKRLVRQKLPPLAVVGDMSNFTLDRPADFAFNLINSFRHLQTEKAATAHLKCMADALVPGGLYVLGLHLTPTKGPALDQEEWSARRGDLRVTWHLKTEEVDRRKRREVIQMRLDAVTSKRHDRFTEEVIFRTYTAAQMNKLLATEPRLECVAHYDFRYNLNQTIEIEPETEDVLYVLRRKRT